MKQEHELVLRQIAKVIPSGGNVGLNNPHDLPNLINWLVPVFLDHGPVHMDEARAFLIQNGQKDKIAAEISEVIDIIDLTVRAVQKNS